MWAGPTFCERGQVLQGCNKKSRYQEHRQLNWGSQADVTVSSEAGREKLPKTDPTGIEWVCFGFKAIIISSLPLLQQGSTAPPGMASLCLRQTPREQAPWHLKFLLVCPPLRQMWQKWVSFSRCFKLRHHLCRAGKHLKLASSHIKLLTGVA